MCTFMRRKDFSFSSKNYNRNSAGKKVRILPVASNSKAAIQWVISFSNVDKRTWEIEKKRLMQQYDVWNTIVSWTNIRMDHVAGSGCRCCYLNCFILGYVNLESWVIAVSSFNLLTFLKAVDQQIPFSQDDWWILDQRRLGGSERDDNL